MRVKPARCLTFAVLAAAVVSIAHAQGLERVAQYYRENLDALRGYTWKSKVTTSVEGEVTSTELYEVRCRDDGTLQRTLIRSERTGRKSKEQDVAADVLSSARELIDAYSHMTPEAFEQAFGDAIRLEIDEPEGDLTRIRSHDVLNPGDSVDVWVDRDRQRLHKIQIESSVRQQPFRLLAELVDLPDGPSYVAKSTFEGRILAKPKKKNREPKSVVIVTENSDHRREGD